jgi:choline dehydrogenase-like flavoprotein
VSTDFDAIVLGSGFGGAVGAARLSTAGYRVLVLPEAIGLNPSKTIAALAERIVTLIIRDGR